MTRLHGVEHNPKPKPDPKVIAASAVNATARAKEFAQHKAEAAALTAEFDALGAAALVHTRALDVIMTKHDALLVREKQLLSAVRMTTMQLRGEMSFGEAEYAPDFQEARRAIFARDRGSKSLRTYATVPKYTWHNIVIAVNYWRTFQKALARPELAHLATTPEIIPPSYNKTVATP